MSISDNQKLDFLWKKLGYGATKTDVNSIKNATNEAIPSPLLLDGNNLWTDAYQIPTLIPTASSHIVEIYDDSGNGSATIETTEDTTASPNRTWKTGLTNWIPPQFGSTYQVKVYIAPSGTSTPQSAGTQVFASGSGNNDEWFFDYQSGVLNFIGDNLPSGIDGNEIFIVGARYIGKLGNRFTALYADSADIDHAFIDSADIVTAYIDSADIMHAIIDSADITLGRIGTAYIDSADIVHAYIDSADIGTAYIDSADIVHAYIDSADIDLLNITGKITGPASFVIDPAAVGDNTGRVIVLGDLQVDGTETTVNSTTVTINDKNIVLADSAPDAVWTDGAGITVAPGLVGAQIKYDQGSDRWVLNRDLSHFDSGGALYFDSGIITHITSDSATIKTLYSTYANIDSADITLARITGLTADSAHVTGDLTVGGDLTVSGNATIKSATGGNIYLGDSNDDNIVFSGDINSHLIPNTNVTFDLGTDSQRWRDLYLSGQSIYLGGLHLVESNGDFVVKKPDGSLTNVRASFIKADSGEIGQLRVDSATISRLSGTSGIFDSMNISKLTTGEIDLGDGNITAGSGTFGSLNVSSEVVAENVRITTNNLLSGAVLTLGLNDSISSSQDLKYAQHLAPTYGHGVANGFLTAKEPILDSGYYRFSVDQTNDEIKGTNVGFKFGVYPLTPKGQYTQTFPFLSDSNTLPFYGLEFNKDTQVLTSTAHTNVFKTSFTKDSAALQGDSSFALQIISSADSDIFSVQRQGKVNVTNNITIGGNIDFTGDLLQNGSPFKAGGVFQENLPTGKAFYITDSSELVNVAGGAPLAALKNAGNTQVFGHVGIQKNNPKYHLDVNGNFAVSGVLDSTGVQNLAYVINSSPAFSSYGLFDDSDKPRLSFISNQAITRGGWFTSANYRYGEMGTFSTAFGDNPKASGEASVAMGSRSIALGAYSVAIGRQSEIQDAGFNDAVVIGSQNIIHGTGTEGDFTTAIGHSQRLSGTKSSIFGAENYVHGQEAGAFGYNNIVGDSDQSSTTSGNTGRGSFVFGSGNRALKNSNILVGIDNEAMNGGVNVLLGKDNYSRSPSGSNVAIGLDNTINATNAMAIGRRITIDSAAEASIGFNLNPGTSVTVLGERIMSVQGGNIIVGEDSDKFANNDGNLYVKGDIVIGGQYLTEGAPGVTTSGTPFVDNGVDVEMTLDRRVIIGKANGIHAFGVKSRPAIDGGRGVHVEGAIAAFNPNIDSSIFDSGGAAWSDEHSIMSYVPKLGTLIAGAMDATDWSSYLENGRLGYHAIALGKENIAAGLQSVSIGAENKIYRGADSDTNALSAIGSETVLIGHQNTTSILGVPVGTQPAFTGNQNYVIGRQNTLAGDVTNTFLIGKSNQVLSKDGNTKIYIVGQENIIDSSAQDIYVIGRNNNITDRAQSINVFGHTNTVDGQAQSINVFGHTNTVDDQAQSINVFGHTNTVDGQAQNAYIFGENNTVDSTTSRNYVFGDNNIVTNDAKNNFVVGRSIQFETNRDSNTAVFWLSDLVSGPSGPEKDSSLNNTKFSIGRLPRVDPGRDYALSVAGSLFLDSGSEIYVGSKSIKGFLGFSEPTVLEPEPAEIGEDVDPSADIDNSSATEFLSSGRSNLGLDSIVFDGTYSNPLGHNGGGSISNVMRVRIPYDHKLYQDGTGLDGTGTFDAKTNLAIRLTNVSTDSSLTTANGLDIGTNFYFADPIDSFQFLVLRDSHRGLPVLNNTSADSNIIEVAVNPTSILGFQFGESGGLKTLSYSPPVPAKIVDPDLNVGGDFSVLGKNLSFSADSLGVIWQSGDLKFRTLGQNPKSITFDSSGLNISSTGTLTAGNIFGDSAKLSGGLSLGQYKSGDAFENYGITILHDSNVQIGGMGFDSFVVRPDGSVINQVIDFLDTDYVQSRVFVSSFFRHDADALYYYPESDNLPLVNPVLIGFKPGGNNTNRPSNTTNNQYGLSVAARTASGAINIVTSNSIATTSNGVQQVDAEGNPIGTIDLTATSPIIVDNQHQWPTPGYLRKTGYIDGEYIRSQAFDELGEAFVKSFVDSAYILSAANDSSEWQRRENTLFFGTFPSVRHVKVGIGTDNPTRKFHVDGETRFGDSALVEGALTLSGRKLNLGTKYEFQIDSEQYLRVVDSDDLLQTDRRGFLGGGTFASVGQAITDANAAYSQGVIVQTSLDNPPGEGSPTQSGKIKLRGFEIFKLDSLGNRIDLKWGGFKPGPLTNFQFDSYTEAYYTPETGVGGNIVIDRDALDSADINVIFRERDIHHSSDPSGATIRLTVGTTGDSAYTDINGLTLQPFNVDHTTLTVRNVNGNLVRTLLKGTDFVFNNDSNITIQDSSAFIALGNIIEVQDATADLNSRLDVFGPTVLGATPAFSLSNPPDTRTFIKGGLTAEDSSTFLNKMTINSSLALTGDSAQLNVGSTFTVDSTGVTIANNSNNQGDLNVAAGGINFRVDSTGMVLPNGTMTIGTSGTNTGNKLRIIGAPTKDGIRLSAGVEIDSLASEFHIDSSVQFTFGPSIGGGIAGFDSQVARVVDSNYIGERIADVWSFFTDSGGIQQIFYRRGDSNGMVVIGHPTNTVEGDSNTKFFVSNGNAIFNHAPANQPDWDVTTQTTTDVVPDFGNSSRHGNTFKGSRMMWIPERGAFRAGAIDGATVKWSDPEVGKSSVGIGYNTLATDFSVGIGYNALAGIMDPTHETQVTGIATSIGFNVLGYAQDGVAVGNTINHQKENTGSISVGYSITNTGLGSDKNVLVGNTVSATGTGDNNVAVGYDVQIAGNGSDQVAIGSDAKTTGTGSESVSIGVATRAGEGGVAVGREATTTKNSGIAIGNNISSVNGGVAIGKTANSSRKTSANTSTAVAVGIDARTGRYNNAVAVGSNVFGAGVGIGGSVNVRYSSGVGIGRNVNSGQGVSIGQNVSSTKSRSVNIGSNNRTYNGTAIGERNTLNRYGQTAIGTDNTSTGTAIGASNDAGRNAVTIGRGNKATGQSSKVLVGHTNSASGNSGTQLIVGYGNTGNSTSARSLTIVGINNKNNTVSNTGDLESIIIGSGNNDNNASVIVGRNNTGNKNVHIFGDNNTSSSPDGASGYIFGSTSTINTNGFLFGSGNTATDNGYAFGSALTVSEGSYAYGAGNTSTLLAMAFGKDNTSVEDNGSIVFGVGNTASTQGLAFGHTNVVSNQGLAFGANNTSDQLNAVALGIGAHASAAGSVVVGVGTTIAGINKTVTDLNTFAVVGDPSTLKVAIGQTQVDPAYLMEIGGHLNIPTGGDYYRHGQVLSDYITQGLITEAYVRNHADSDYIESTIDLQYLRETITPAFFFASNTTTNDLEFTGTGSVGIGRANTNSSKYKLDVDGSINYTGKLYLDGDLIIPSKDSLNDVYITHQTLNLSIGPDSAESYFDSAYVSARQQMFGFTQGQTYDEVIDASYINSLLDATQFLDSSEAQQLIDATILTDVAFKLDDPLLTGLNVTSFLPGNTSGVRVGINKTASTFVDAAFIQQGALGVLQVDGNITIENGNLYLGEDGGTSQLYINGERLENNTTFDATGIAGQTTYTLSNRIVVDVGGNPGTIPTPTYDMEVVGSFNIGSRSGKDAEIRVNGQDLFDDILDSAYVQARQLVGIDSNDVLLMIDSTYVKDLADSDYIRTVPDSAFIESFISQSFIRSNADSDYILSAADSAYVLSIADSAYVEGIADSDYIKGFIDQAYIRSNADSNYVKGFITQAYIRDNADSNYVKGFITQDYVRNFTDSSYILSAADSAYVATIAGNLVDSAYVLNIADSAYVSSIAGIKDSAEVIAIATNLVDSGYVNAITGIGTRDVDFGTNKIIYSNAYPGTSTRPNAGSFPGFFSVLTSTNKPFVTVQGLYKELALLEDIDSAYIQARIVPEGVDSAAVESMVDSAYVNARVSTVDSAQVLAIVDSGHVKSIVDSDYILSIASSGGGGGTGTGGGSLVGFNFIASNGQTVFSGSDIDGTVLSYDATTATIVTANGITLTKGVDYSHTDSSNLTFTDARDSGDEISIFTTKAAADAGSAGSTGTTSTTVTGSSATIFDRTMHNNNFKSIEYTIHMEDSSLSHSQITKILATYNKSQVFSTQYGTVSTFAGDSDLGNIDVIETGGQIVVRLTKASGTGTVKVVSNKTVVN